MIVVNHEAHEMTRKSSQTSLVKTGAEKLAAHPLTKTVLDNLRPLLDTASRGLEASAQQGKIRSTDDHKLWEYEWYDHAVFSYVSAMISAIENLERSQHFIRSFPQPRSYEKKGVRQHDWIEYHYSHYLITLVSVFDIALTLANTIFRLGNRERDCKKDLITKNSWVSRTPVASALDELDPLIKPYREGRNLHVHRGRVPKISSAMNSEYLDKLDLFSFVQICGKPVVDRSILQLAYKGQVKQICARLRKETDSIRDNVWQLFDKLAPIYENKSMSLRSELREMVEKELERRKNLKSKAS
jgi:hypothetical protein